MQRDASETTCTSSSSANVPNLPGRRAETLIARLADGLRDDQFWSDLFRRRACGECSHWALHVAIFQEPFLTWIIEGRKRVESRFSHHQVAPYGDVGAGDVIALKRVGGPIVGVCLATACWSYRLDPNTWSQIRDRFAPLLCAESEDFWTSRKDARFATLVSIDQVRSVCSIDYHKSDRRGWVIERNRVVQQIMDL